MERARTLGAVPAVLLKKFRLKIFRLNEEGVAFTFEGAGRGLTSEPLHGSFQVENCSLAVAGMIVLSKKFPKITDSVLVNGVAAAQAGRFEILRPAPPLILDGAHNPDGMRRLVESLLIIYGNRPAALYASMKDKDFSEGLSLLKEGAETCMYLGAK